MLHDALPAAFHTLGPAVRDEIPIAQLLETNTSVSYIFMLTIDNKGESNVLVKGFWFYQP